MPAPVHFSVRSTGQHTPRMTRSPDSPKSSPRAPSPGNDDGLSITFEGGDNELVVALAGDIDAGSHDRFREALCAGFNRSRNVTLDLAAVEFMDSTGLNGIVWARHEASQHDKQLAIRGAPDRVRRVLAITDLEHLVQPTPSRADA